MKKLQQPAQLFLRLALGIGYLVPALDRLGVWGKNGQPGISWGDWQHFMQYAGEVMSFMPAAVVTLFAAIATIAEICFGILLLLGKWTTFAALGSGVLALSFAVSMALSFGIVSPLSYSVFTVSACSFLLATIEKYNWSLDNRSTSK
ncbi:DoxX family membrane protein [Ferruginibacter profundus]